MIIIIQLIDGAFSFYETLIAIWTLLSWFPAAKESRLAGLLDRIVGPYIEVFDRFVPSIGGINFSALVGIWVLYMGQQGLISVLLRLFWRN